MTPRAARKRKATGKTLLSLSCGDFQRNEEGTWETARQINITGAGGEQMLVPAGRKFGKGQMFILGLDLAVVLERQCDQ